MKSLLRHCVSYKRKIDSLFSRLFKLTEKEGSQLRATGPCITNVFATRRKNFSQWHRSFQRKLLSHWLKFLRHVAITLVIQGPDLLRRKSPGGRWIPFTKPSTVETLYNTVNFCWSTHKRHSIARPKGRGMGCLLWVQRTTYCVHLSKLSSIKYLL